MAKKVLSTYYIIDGDNEVFRTLTDAKHHIWLQTKEDQKSYIGRCIMRIKNDEIRSYTEIKNDGNDGVCYSKTIC